MSQLPRILGIATAVPAHVLDTAHVVQQAGRIFARFGDEFQRMLPVFTNTGIDRRYSVCPPEWFNTPRGWPEKSKIFLDGACDLFRRAGGEALARANLEAKDIDVIVSVSSTGIATPSIEAHVLHEMGFRDDVQRVPVFGLGCAGGMSGLAIAARMAKATPGTKVLVVVIELCTLAFRPDEMTKSNIIATALFGDGAAALVISAVDGAQPAIEHAGEHTWPGTIGVMGWRIDPEGFGAIFSRSIPDLAAQDLRPAADFFLQRNNLAFHDFTSYSFHPGGTKVIQALETAFELGSGALQIERRILAGFGNMSAPTVLFVLNEALHKPAPGRRFMCALGPGFTASFMTLLHP